jgi:hypothetical protein
VTLTSSDKARFVAAQLDEAERAWASVGGSEQTYDLGGCRLCVRFVNGSLQDLVLPVLSHAQCSKAPAAVDVVIYAIDASSSDFSSPPEAWPFAEEETQDYQRVCWRPDERIAFTSDESRGIWHLHDFASNRGLYWIRNSQNLPFWEAGSPLRHAIHWATMSVSQAMIHAAAIGTGERGFLLTGAGGSGKSTTTAAAIERGWLTTGDDFVLVSTAGEITASPIFDVMKLTAMSMDWFPGHSRHALNIPSEPHEKTLVPLSAVAEQRFVRKLPVHALLCLQLTGAETSTFELASKTKAIAALAPSTMNILRTAMPETLAACCAIARALPTILFKVGRDPFEAVAALETLAKEDDGTWQQLQQSAR